MTEREGRQLRERVESSGGGEQRRIQLNPQRAVPF